MSASSHNLETSTIVLAALCGLYGVYVILFALTMWTLQRHGAAPALRLQVVTVFLFLSLLLHFIVRSLEFSRSRIANPPEDEFFQWTILLTVAGKVATSFAGLCADGLLVWRFYVIYERKWWAKWIPGSLVAANALVCWAADMETVVMYSEPDYFQRVLLPVALDLTVTWGWFMFTINTVLTSLIVWRIVSISRRAGQAIKGRLDLALRAMIESGAVTWIALLAYEIASLAPQGQPTANMDIGYVIFNVLPVFFGISQCLIVLRLYIANELEAVQHASSSQKPLEVSVSIERSRFSSATSTLEAEYCARRSTRRLAAIIEDQDKYWPSEEHGIVLSSIGK